MKLFCAGAGTYPTVTAMTGLFSGLDLFASFYDVRDVETFEQLRRNHRPKSIVCDSGAHAYFSGSGGGIKSASVVKLTTKLPPPKEFVLRYAALISQALLHVDQFIEFDTVQMHGRKFQQWQRDCLLEAVKGDRSRLIPVYHACEPRLALANIMDEYPYIALEGRRSKDLTTADYLAICYACYQHQIKVHVFASIDRSFLMKVPIYSSDSSSWSMIYRGGVYTQFTGRALRPLHKTEARVRFGMALGHTQSLSRVRCDRPTVFRYRELFRSVLEQYQKFAQYLTDVWTERGVVWS